MLFAATIALIRSRWVCVSTSVLRHTEIDNTTARKICEQLGIRRRKRIMDVRYITDENGKRVGVIQDIKEYERLLEAFKELEDIRAYDEAMEDLAAGEKSIPLEKVVAEIERERQSG